MTKDVSTFREQIRAKAVENVDRRCGYTMEFAPSPLQHRIEYDEEEQRLLEESLSSATHSDDAMTRAAARYVVHNARTIATLPEPAQRALIACQIPYGPGDTWTNRTYEVIRHDDGRWLIDFGAGPVEPRQCWADVRDWLRYLGARDVEILELP